MWLHWEEQTTLWLSHSKIIEGRRKADGAASARKIVLFLSFFEKVLLFQKFTEIYRNYTARLV